jgi:hypothetical protein
MAARPYFAAFSLVFQPRLRCIPKCMAAKAALLFGPPRCHNLCAAPLHAPPLTHRRIFLPYAAAGA